MLAQRYLPAREGPISSSSQILTPGRTCWTTAHAERASVVVDAAAYFSAAKTAILAAKHAVFLIGWDFDTRIVLEPDDPAPDVPNTLGPFLSYVVRRRPGLQIFVLRWDLAFLKMPFRGTTPLFVLDWMTSRRLHFRLDSQHPAGACHHQKIVVIDDALAVCGGIDMTVDRWDTPDHLDHDRRRVRPNGEAYGPWHDATMVVQGDAARCLGELARERWYRATGSRIGACPPRNVHWPAPLQVDFRDVAVAIARTVPEYNARPAVREIEALYLAAIAAARHTIYIETQYFSSSRITEALASRLAEENGPEVVIVNPASAAGWLEEKTMGSARAIFYKQLRKADKHDRFRFYTPVTEHGCDIYVHAKVMVIDDILLRVGSSNLNNRSMGLDTECDLAIEARSDEDAGASKAITQIRTRLLAEHLGVAPDTLSDAIATRQGRLIDAIDSLRRDTGRSLRKFTPPELNTAEETLAESELLNSDHPEDMSETFKRHLEALPSPARPGRIADAAALGIGLSILMWRRFRR
ncbi:MAG: phospholipase D-like domain-containing protein [Hyphomicrobiales bacterium]